MKKFLLFLLAAGVSFAQALAEKPATSQQIGSLIPKQGTVKQQVVNRENFKPATPLAQRKAVVPVTPMMTPKFQSRASQANLLKSRHKMPSSTLMASYKAPEGTFYMGVDKEGFGLCYSLPTFIGGWLSGLDAYKYENNSVGEDLTFTWDSETSETAQYYEDIIAGLTGYTEEEKDELREYYGANNRIGKKMTIDPDNNLIDSATAQNKYQWLYYSGMARPVLMASTASAVDTFAVNTFYQPAGEGVEPLDTLLQNGSVANGIEFKWPANPDNNQPAEMMEEHGYWPMTTFPSFYMYDELYDEDGNPYYEGNEYANYAFAMRVSQSDPKPHYLFGSDTQYFYAFTEEGFAGGELVKPEMIVISYDKPQTPLYIHDITIPILALNQTNPIVNNNYNLERPVFTEVQLNILDAEYQTLVSITATPDDTTSNYFTGYTMNFKIQEVDEYGEIISEGITLTDAFSIQIMGHTADGSNIGFLSGYEPYTWPTTVYTAEGLAEGKYYVSEYSPMVVLNGNFITLECANQPIENNGDLNQVVDIEMVDMEDGSGNYLGVIRNEPGSQYQYSYIGIYSTNIPMDTTTYDINFGFSAPDGYELDFDCKYDEQYEYNPWDEYGLSTIYIFAPVFHKDDEIVISNGGRSITFHVTNGEESALNKVSADGLTSVENINGEFRLTYTNDFDRVEVIGANGQTVADHKLPQSGEFTINASAMPNGVYMFRMTGKNVKEVLRAVK